MNREEFGVCVSQMKNREVGEKIIIKGRFLHFQDSKVESVPRDSRVYVDG